MKLCLICSYYLNIQSTDLDSEDAIKRQHMQRTGRGGEREVEGRETEFLCYPGYHICQWLNWLAAALECESSALFNSCTASGASLLWLMANSLGNHLWE